MKHASAKILTPSRRTFIGGMGAGILALGARPLFAQDAPNRGGVLRIATYTQSTNDTCDPAKFVQAGDYMRARCFYNTLTWINAADEAIPELAESFEAIDDSLMRWRFKLASGVKFHDGSPLTVEDVRFSILRHKTVPSAASALAENVVDVHADGADSVIIELNTPNIDFPLLIGTYHFSIIKDGTEDFTVPNGTGPFRVKEFRPGMRTSGVRFEDYWRNGLPYLDEFEIFSILDNEARVAALLSGDVHLINQLAGPAIDQVAGSDAAQILVTESRHITTMQYRMDLPMTDSLDFRLAMCYLMDRQRYLDVTLRGYGVIANDTPRDRERQRTDPRQSRTTCRMLPLPTCDMPRCTSIPEPCRIFCSGASRLAGLQPWVMRRHSLPRARLQKSLIGTRLGLAGKSPSTATAYDISIF